MDHEDHVVLLRNGVTGAGGTWADLGAGSGAFTLALADLLGPTATIQAVDRDRRSLGELERVVHLRFPDVHVVTLIADITKPLPLAGLDGVVMANSLHFVREKDPVVDLVRGYLRPGGRLLFVEYNVSQGNVWVPYPITFAAWKALAERCGFGETRLLATRPSRFLREIYSAVSVAP